MNHVLKLKKCKKNERFAQQNVYLLDMLNALNSNAKNRGETLQQLIKLDVYDTLRRLMLFQTSIYPVNDRQMIRVIIMNNECDDYINFIYKYCGYQLIFVNHIGQKYINTDSNLPTDVIFYIKNTLMYVIFECIGNVSNIFYTRRRGKVIFKIGFVYIPHILYSLQ